MPELFMIIIYFDGGTARRYYSNSEAYLEVLLYKAKMREDYDRACFYIWSDEALKYVIY